MMLCGALRTLSAAGPEANYLFPAGGQRGTAVEVTAGGNFAQWPVQAWASRPGLTFAAREEKGKLTATIAADAQPGLYWIRLFDAQGVSVPRPFIVGTLAQVVEQEPNDTAVKAQALPSTAVEVDGKLGAAGDVDLYRVPLTKGQTLVAALTANETIASPVDAVLQIIGPRGNLLAYNHDQHGLDPRIVFTAPADGDYLVRLFGFPSVPNSTIGFAGSDSYLYRLAMTTGPWINHAWPLAVRRDQETRVELRGWNLTDAQRALTVQPRSAELWEMLDVQAGNTTRLLVEPHATAAEMEPNPLATPQSIELPITISGAFAEKRDVDAFRFSAGAGESLVFDLLSRSLGFPLDGVLEITDATGKSLARVDDSVALRDASIAFTAPAAGQFVVTVSELTAQFGEDAVYLLRARKAAADFEVTSDTHAYTLSSGKPTEITLTIARQAGFAEEIRFRITGLPDYVSVQAPVSAAEGESSKTVKLVLNSTGGPFTGPLRIVAESTGPGKLQHGVAATLGTPPTRLEELWLTVLPAAP